MVASLAYFFICSFLHLCTQAHGHLCMNLEARRGHWVPFLSPFSYSFENFGCTFFPSQLSSFHFSWNRCYKYSQGTPCYRDAVFKLWFSQEVPLSPELSPQSLILTASVPMTKSPLEKNTVVIDNSLWSHLALIKSAKVLFLDKVTFMGWRLSTGEDTIQPVTLSILKNSQQR